MKNFIIAALLALIASIVLGIHTGTIYKPVDALDVQTKHTLKCVLTDEGKACREDTVRIWIERGSFPAL